MSSNTGNVAVKTVRIRWVDTSQVTTHSQSVTVGIPKDRDTGTPYLRIVADGKTILSEELHHFQWLDGSCTKVVTAIDSTNIKIVIVYDSKDRTAEVFFTEMERLIKQGPQRSTPPPPQPPTPKQQGERTEAATKDLLKFIQEGSVKETERPIQYLAQSKTNIQFNLLTDNNNGSNNAATTADPRPPSSDVLQLTLHIECHLNRDPIVAPISVRSGTDLFELKKQIESETGIKRKDQYWYAFDQYIIADNYKFGSTDPVVPPLSSNAPKGLAKPPSNPIRNGDHLIMYIAQTRPSEI